MPDDPVQQCLVETNIPAGPFALDPFVSQDLVAFGLQLPVKEEVLDGRAVFSHANEWFEAAEKSHANGFRE